MILIAIRTVKKEKHEGRECEMISGDNVPLQARWSANSAVIQNGEGKAVKVGNDS